MKMYTGWVVALGVILGMMLGLVVMMLSGCPNQGNKMTTRVEAERGEVFTVTHEGKVYTVWFYRGGDCTTSLLLDTRDE